MSGLIGKARETLDYLDFYFSVSNMGNLISFLSHANTVRRDSLAALLAETGQTFDSWTHIGTCQSWGAAMSPLGLCDTSGSCLDSAVGQGTRAERLQTVPDIVTFVMSPVPGLPVPSPKSRDRKTLHSHTAPRCQVPVVGVRGVCGHTSPVHVLILIITEPQAGWVA